MATTVGNANACLACLNVIAIGAVCAYCCAPRPHLGVVRIGNSYQENSAHLLPLLAVVTPTSMERESEP